MRTLRREQRRQKQLRARRMEVFTDSILEGGFYVAAISAAIVLIYMVAMTIKPLFI